MCRIACYLGREILLKDLLLEPHHSLLKQSWEPLEMREGRLNADGYGFGWYDDNGRAARYSNPMPIWTDPNLEPLARSLSKQLWMANVRSATRNMDVSHANTQPFLDDRYIFLHNGYIKDFPTEVRHGFRCGLDADIDAHVHGTTDSEYLFALFRQLRRKHQNFELTDLLAALLDDLGKSMAGRKCLLNIAVSDGQNIVASRHAVNGDCPSLYYTVNNACFPDAVVVASEPLHPDRGWVSLPNHSIISIDDNGHADISPL
ncbi:MAG: ergothioneine biosynthesis protein EgtC [Gammaproteobacteria bacterium]|nr:ergothioneine biosynthesis protein EgtC [Gammaproteobacteria bacterium]